MLNYVSSQPFGILCDAIKQNSILLGMYNLPMNKI